MYIEMYFEFKELSLIQPYQQLMVMFDPEKDRLCYSSKSYFERWDGKLYCMKGLYSRLGNRVRLIWIILKSMQSNDHWGIWHTIYASVLL